MLSRTLIRHGSKPFPCSIIVPDGRWPQPAVFSKACDSFCLYEEDVASVTQGSHRLCDNSHRNLSFTTRNLISLVHTTAAVATIACKVTESNQATPDNIGNIGSLDTVSEKYLALNDDAISVRAYYVCGMDGASDDELIDGLSRLDHMSKTHSVVCAKRELQVELLSRGVRS